MLGLEPAFAKQRPNKDEIPVGVICNDERIIHIDPDLQTEQTANLTQSCKTLIKQRWISMRINKI
jgi:hypothetical protein